MGVFLLAPRVDPCYHLVHGNWVWEWRGEVWLWPEALLQQAIRLAIMISIFSWMGFSALLRQEYFDSETDTIDEAAWYSWDPEGCWITYEKPWRGTIPPTIVEWEEEGGNTCAFMAVFETCIMFGPPLNVYLGVTERVSQNVFF